MNRLPPRLLPCAAVLLALAVVPAGAAEISLIAPGGIRAAFEDLIPQFEKQSGITVKATYGSGLGTRERVLKGEAFDVPVVQLPLEPVRASGHVDTASETPLATVSVGLAVRPGQAKPDISTAAAVKALLLGARSIAFPNASGGAAAGVSFEATLRTLGIADAMKQKIKPAQGGVGAMRLLAQGEVEYGLTFVSEIISEPGVEAVGPLPRDISPPTALVAYVSAASKEPAAAKALVAFLSSPTAAAVYKAHGMAPGS